MEEAPSYCTYHEAYEVNCARYGREPDMPIIVFKQRCADSRGMVPPEPSVRQQVFTDVCTHIVNENVFSQYAYKSLPSSTHLWAFKKQLCAQTALSGGWLRKGGEGPEVGKGHFAAQVSNGACAGQCAVVFGIRYQEYMVFEEGESGEGRMGKFVGFVFGGIDFVFVRAQLFPLRCALEGRSFTTTTLVPPPRRLLRCSSEPETTCLSTPCSLRAHSSDVPHATSKRALSHQNPVCQGHWPAVPDGRHAGREGEGEGARGAGEGGV